eukprot:3479589-Rhodomonas_salina.2
MNDAWRLLDYNDPNLRSWREIAPSSRSPPPRALHASWMIGGTEGFKVVIHGGQSTDGAGEVLELPHTPDRARC